MIIKILIAVNNYKFLEISECWNTMFCKINQKKQTNTTVIINVRIAILKKEFYERIIEIESIFNVFEVYLTKIIWWNKTWIVFVWYIKAVF